MFWDKISALYYDYEVTGKDSYVVMHMTGGLEVVLNTSSINRIGGDFINGVLDKFKD